MKSCDEMVKNLFERRDDYAKKQKSRKKILTRAVTSVAALCLVLAVSIGVLQGNIFKDSVKEPENDIKNEQVTSNTPSEESGDGREEKNENLLPSTADVIGLVVVDGVTYIQDTFADPDSYVIDRFIGNVDEYEGSYNPSVETKEKLPEVIDNIINITGELYTVKDDSDVLIAKFSNGGTIILRKE